VNVAEEQSTAPFSMDFRTKEATPNSSSLFPVALVFMPACDLETYYTFMISILINI
jgi:hypothetical protein